MIFVLYFYIFIVKMSSFKKELKSRTDSTENLISNNLVQVEEWSHYTKAENIKKKEWKE